LTSKDLKRDVQCLVRIEFAMTAHGSPILLPERRID
jgi:hypothetical protein